jgi:hypothetical protein
MTREDALLYLPCEVEDDLDDLYESKLFEFKQKVLNAAPSTKLFDFHLKKARKLYEAYAFLSGRQEEFVNNGFTLDNPEMNLKLAWQKFNRNKNKLKLLISNSNEFEEIEFLLGKLIENQKQFASLFVNLTFDETLSMVVSKEPDAMALSVDIDKFYLSEGGDIKAIQKLDKENLLFQEANRLSLWLKIENDVR